MNSTPTDTQLKQALAKMLPERIKWTVSPPQYPDWCCLVWLNSTPTREVLDTELLHLCWMVEKTLQNDEKAQYINVIYSDEENHLWTIHPDCHASWQQRVIALAKVKGIKIV